MELKLAPEEGIIKSWDYACSLVANERAKQDEVKQTKLNITLTNKRCVLQQETGLNIERREVLLKDVCGVTTERKVMISSSKRTVGKVIIGILFILAGLLLFVSSSILKIDIPIVVRVVGGILFILIGVFLCSSGKETTLTAFAIKIYTRTLNCDVISDSIGFGFLYNPKKKEKSDGAIVTLFVDPAIIKDIIENIGALIVENS